MLFTDFRKKVAPDRPLKPAPDDNHLRNIVLLIMLGMTLLSLALLIQAPIAIGGTRTPVFPGAVGFGVDAYAGRYGRTLHVTNLNDTGEGSLRAAVEFDGPRTIVFDVSGTINLAGNIDVVHPFLTIAGQTAPSPGITIKGAGLYIQTHNVLIQHLRLRPGDVAGMNVDAVSIRGPSHHVVIDHVSVSWATDENIGIFGPPGEVHDVTISNCIISESLQYGVLIGDLSVRISLIGNLLAHNPDRNALIKSSASAVLLNNLIYNPAGSAFISLGANDNRQLPALLSAVGNVFIAGSDTHIDIPAIKVERRAPMGTSLYISDNLYQGTLLKNQSPYPVNAVLPNVWHKILINLMSEQRSSLLVEEWVLNNAGARPENRDSVDQRIVDETRKRLGKNIKSQAEVGGWPTLPEVVRPVSIPESPGKVSE
jgi:hypothetical protein